MTATGETTMHLEDIRPKAHMINAHAVKADVLADLFQSGRIQASDLRRTDRCPLCAEAASTLFLQKYDLEYVRCRGCGLIYQSRSLKDEIRHRFYSASSYFDTTTQNIQIKTYNTRKYGKFGPILDRIRQVVPADQPLRLLDIGCSTGYFLDLARERTRWQGLGLEFNQHAVRFAQDQGLDVRPLDVMTLSPEEFRFDLVTAFGLLGRISDPSAFAAQVFNLLDPGGAVIITTPNCAGFEMAVVGPEHEYYDPIDTCCGFDADNIRLLLTKAGFRDSHIHTPGTMDLDIIRRHIEDYQRPVRLNAFEQRLIFSREDGLDQVRSDFTDWLIRSGMSGLMEVTAFKPAVFTQNGELEK